MRANRDGKAVVPGNGGYDIEVIEVTGPPDRMMPMPPAKSRGRLIPMGTGENLPDRPSPVLGSGAHLRNRVPLVPTLEEFASLLRWAQVAFTARCARRVLPAYKHFWKGAPEHHLQAVNGAVRVAEHAAAAAALAADAIDAAAATKAVDSERFGHYVSLAANRVADAASLAIRDACNASARADFGFGASHAGACAAANAADNAARVIFETATIDTPLTAQLRCIRRDFVRLKKLARKEKWTDDTPVPLEVFGPLWPEGIAPYWAVETPAQAPGG